MNDLKNLLDKCAKNLFAKNLFVLEEKRKAYNSTVQEIKQFIKQKIEKEVNISKDLENIDNLYLLMLADSCSEKEYSLTKLFIAYGANPSRISKCNETYLGERNYIHELSTANNSIVSRIGFFMELELEEDAVKLLIDQKEIIQSLDNNDKLFLNNAISKSLHVLMSRNNIILIESLVNSKLLNSYSDPMGNTLLHIAVLNNSFKSANIIIKAGLYNNSRDSNGDTPLVIAARNLNDELKDNRLLNLLSNAFDEHQKQCIDKKDDNNKWQFHVKNSSQKNLQYCFHS